MWGNLPLQLMISGRAWHSQQQGGSARKALEYLRRRELGSFQSQNDVLLGRWDVFFLPKLLAYLFQISAWMSMPPPVLDGLCVSVLHPSEAQNLFHNSTANDPTYLLAQFNEEKPFPSFDLSLIKTGDGSPISLPSRCFPAGLAVALLEMLCFNSFICGVLMTHESNY